MAKKKVNSNISKPNYPKEVSFNDDYYCYYSFKRIPVSEGYIYDLCLRILNDSLDDDCLTLNDIYIKNNICEMDASRWRKKYDFFDKSLLRAKKIVGNRRERGALKFKLQATLVERSMPLYDDDWKELEQWRTKIKSLIASNINSVEEYKQALEQVLG